MNASLTEIAVALPLVLRFRSMTERIQLSICAAHYST